jgi:glycerophosphoryl diester phosphodiesterase/HEAT repeat protein
MKKILAVLLAAFASSSVHAEALLPGGVQLLCHRTANEDVPENTLESLQQATLLGCNVVEIDLRRTLDGKIVLNHDGILERLTDGVGEVETSYYDQLKTLDLGSWMGKGFTGMRIALLDDALRLARERDIRLVLDMKDKGIGVDVLQILEREGMLQRVQFGGEWADVKKLYPGAMSPGDGTAWVQPDVTAEQVKEYHRQGKSVVANFSANDHEMDLAGMKAAVAAGVDAINVDYPRLGADAVGRSVERMLHALILKANAGESGARVAAIQELSRYMGFPLQGYFTRWLLDADASVSRAAALALVMAHPMTPSTIFAAALQSENADVRANATWALGMTNPPVSMLTALLRDKDPRVLQAALLALARLPGEVSADRLLPLLSNDDAAVRGAAARALARHQPEVAIQAVPAQLRKEVAAERILYEEHKKRQDQQFTQPEIAAIQSSFRCQMEMMRAISMLQSDEATRELVALALRPDKDFSEFNGIVAGFQLWDRMGSNAASIVEALGSDNIEVAERAAWTLIKAGPAVLPDVRKALDSSSAVVRQRAIRIVAWQGDKESLEKLRAMQSAGGAEATLADWAVDKIETLDPQL